MNMYSYVGEDPINRIDPTGKTCTMTDGKADCKVDDPGKLNKKEVNAINKAYTNAVNRLLKNPNKQSTITVNGKSFNVTAGTQAKALMGAVVKGGTNTDARASTKNGTLNPSKTDSGGPEITVNRVGISKPAMESRNLDIALGKTIIHESFHLAPGEKEMQEQWNASPDQYNDDHRDSYNRAASELWRQ